MLNDVSLVDPEVYNNTRVKGQIQQKFQMSQKKVKLPSKVQITAKNHYSVS
jgi:hypothetical protein